MIDSFIHSNPVDDQRLTHSWRLPTILVQEQHVTTLLNTKKEQQQQQQQLPAVANIQQRTERIVGYLACRRSGQRNTELGRDKFHDAIRLRDAGTMYYSTSMDGPLQRQNLPEKCNGRVCRAK